MLIRFFTCMALILGGALLFLHSIRVVFGDTVLILGGTMLIPRDTLQFLFFGTID